MKRLIVALALFAVAGVVPAQAAPERVGVVDMQRAVSESREGKAARAEVLRKKEQYSAELKTLLEQIEGLKSDLKKNGSTLSAEQRGEKEQQLQQKGRDFQKRQRDAQEELKLLETDRVNAIVKRLGQLLGKIGDEGGYAVILDQAVGVRYLSKAVDVTPLLVKKADETSGN